MNRFMLSLCVITSYCAGAAHDDPVNLGRQLIQIMPYVGMPTSYVAYVRPKNTATRIFAVAVCNEQKDFARGAAQAAANYASTHPAIGVAELWCKVTEFYQNSPSYQNKPTLLVALLTFRREANWSYLSGDGSATKTVFRGQLLLPQNDDQVITLENCFDRDLSYPIPVGSPMEMCCIDINHAVFEALEEQAKESCEIL